MQPPMLPHQASQEGDTSYRGANLRGHCSAVLTTQRRLDLEERCGVSHGDWVAY